IALPAKTARWNLCGWWAAAIRTSRAARFRTAGTRPRETRWRPSKIWPRGVRSVSADIVGDDTAYVWQPYADGWSIDDPVWDYGAAVSALSINDNTLSVSVLPGSYESDPARIVLTPPVEYYDIDNRVRTAPSESKAERKIMVERLPGARQLRIWGALPLKDPGDTEV